MKNHLRFIFSKLDYIILLSSLLLGSISIFLLKNESILLNYNSDVTDKPKVAVIGNLVNDVRVKNSYALSWKSIEKDQDLFDGDTIFSGNQSNLLITFNDNQSIQVGENSLVKIESNSEEPMVNLKFGTVKLKVNGTLKVKTREKDYIFEGKNSEVKIDISNKTPQISEVSKDLKITEEKLQDESNSITNEETLVPETTSSDSLNDSSSLGKIAEVQWPSEEVKLIYPINTEIINCIKAFCEVNFEFKIINQIKNEQFIQISESPTFEVITKEFKIENHPKIELPLGQFFWRIKPNEFQKVSDLNIEEFKIVEADTIKLSDYIEPLENIKINKNNLVKFIWNDLKKPGRYIFCLKDLNKNIETIIETNQTEVELPFSEEKVVKWKVFFIPENSDDLQPIRGIAAVNNNEILTRISLKKNIINLSAGLGTFSTYQSGANTLLIPSTGTKTNLNFLYETEINSFSGRFNFAVNYNLLNGQNSLKKISTNYANFNASYIKLLTGFFTSIKLGVSNQNIIIYKTSGDLDLINQFYLVQGVSKSMSFRNYIFDFKINLEEALYSFPTYWSLFPEIYIWNSDFGIQLNYRARNLSVPLPRTGFDFSGNLATQSAEFNLNFIYKFDF